MSARADSLARLLERGHQRRAARVVVRGAGKRMGGMERMGRARARPAADGEDTRATAVLPLSLSLSLSRARAILAISIYDDGPLRAPFSPDGPPPFHTQNFLTAAEAERMVKSLHAVQIHEVSRGF